jgi:hypothetical protein
VSNFPAWIQARLSPTYVKEQEAIAEEQRLVREKAANYDKLINMVGHHQFVDVIKERVNYEIAEATKDPLDVTGSQIHVMRWNAMREALDAGLNDIEAARKERDRLNAEEQEYLQMQQQQERGVETDA